jgi:hypothetical protein
MKFLPSVLAAAATLLLSTTATAQLKAPRDNPVTRPAAPQAATPAANANANAEDLNAGRLAAAGWLVLLDRRDWGRAWESASAEFRTSVPLGGWMDSIPKSREGLGAFIERTPTDAQKTTLDGRPGGDYVTVVFASKFEKKEMREVVTTVREPDGKWRVTGYSPQ